MPALALIASAAGVAFAQEPNSLPVSRLPLELTGLMTGVLPPARPACLVRCDGPQQRNRLLFVGDRACDLAEVREIRTNSVVILNLTTGALEALRLPEARPVAAPPVSGLDSRVDEPPAPGPSNDVLSVKLPKKLLEGYLANLGEVLTSAFAAPRTRASEEGEPVIDGFEISRIVKGGPVDRLGVRDGDVILAVNGEPLDSMATLVRLFGQLPVLSASRLTILRGNKTTTLVITVE